MNEVALGAVTATGSKCVPSVDIDTWMPVCVVAGSTQVSLTAVGEATLATTPLGAAWPGTNVHDWTCWIAVYLPVPAVNPTYPVRPPTRAGRSTG